MKWVERLRLHCLRITSCVAPILFLVGCAGQSSIQQGYVRDTIQGELKQAREARSAPVAPANLDLSLLPPLQTDAPRPSTAADGRFDLSVQNAPAIQVFQGIVSGTQYSMLVAPEVTGNLTITLRNVTVREALNAIRDMYGYEYRVQGNRINILPNTLQTRVFQVNYLASRRIGTTDMRVSSSSQAGTTSGTGTTGTTGTTTNTTSTGTATGTTNAYGSTAASGSNSGSAVVSTRTDSDFWKEVKEALTAIVGSADGRSVVLSPASGVIVVRGFPADIRNVETYLRATQGVIERQVMLEAKIIEVNLSDAYQAGVNWGAFHSGSNGSGNFAIGNIDSSTTLAALGNSTTTISNSNATITTGLGGAISAATGATSGFVGLALQTSNFAALLNFLETQGTVNVLSSPRIATLNNQKAVLKVGSDDYYVTAVSAGSSTVANGVQSNTSPSYTTQVFFSGIALDVTPQIDDGENIVLHVHPAISTVSQGKTSLPTGDATVKQVYLPTNEIREADSIVRVQDGRIVAIGGLMKQAQNNTSNQLPGIGNMPVASEIFGNKNQKLVKQELVILIKPTIIRGTSDWQADLTATQERLESLGR